MSVLPFVDDVPLPMPSVRVSLDLAPGGLAVRVSGVLTARTVRPLDALLRRLSRAPRSLFVDLAGIREVDEAGLARLVAISAAPVRAGHAAVHIVNPSPPVELLLGEFVGAG